MSETKDVVVAGGGIAGLAFALALRRGAGGARVAVADPSFAVSGTAPRSLRAVAVAAGSRRFLDSLGVWEAVAEEAQPMVDMVITDGRDDDAPRPVFLEFDGEAAPDEPFAFMVFQDRLRAAALLDAAGAAGVEVLKGRIDGFRRQGPVLVLSSGEASLAARLLVAADGGRSRLREAAGSERSGGITTRRPSWRPYRIRCLTTAVPRSISCPEARWPVLPLRAEDGSERRFSLVWTTEPGEARRLVALPRAAFLEALESRIGHGYGSLTLDDEPRAYPASPHASTTARRSAFRAARRCRRTIHPLAGQGLNLGLRDAAALSESVAEALNLGLDPATPDILDAYERARRFDAVLMAGATDGLNRLFSNDRLPARLLRDFGMGLVDRWPALKRLFVRDDAAASPVPRPSVFGAEADGHGLDQKIASPAMMPSTRKMMKITTKMKKRILAMPPAAAEMPPKPKTPATIEMMKKISAHFSIGPVSSKGSASMRRSLPGSGGFSVAEC